MSPITVPDDRLTMLTESQVGELLGLSTEGVQHLRETGRLRFENVGRGSIRKAWRIPRVRVERFALGDTDPIEQALANPKPQPRRVRKPQKQHV